MAGEIIRKRIYETLLALKVGAIKTFTEIKLVGPLSSVEAHPELGTLRTHGVEPLFVLGDFRFSLFEFIAPCGLALIDSGPKKHEHSEDNFFHGFPP
jgi:hypothetical protein